MNYYNAIPVTRRVQPRVYSNPINQAVSGLGSVTVGQGLTFLVGIAILGWIAYEVWPREF